MTGTKGSATMIGSLILLLAAGCGGAESMDVSSDSGAQGLETPVTHDEVSTEEAEIAGILQGTPRCLWLQVGNERFALIVPAGSATRAAGDEVILLDPDGTEIARSGDEVTVIGGIRRDHSPCLDAGADERVIVAGAVASTAT